MFELAAEAASGYGPNIVGAVISGLMTGVVAAGVAWWTARHEVKQSEKRREQEQQDRKEQEAHERAERQALDDKARSERRARDDQERAEREARDERARAERDARDAQERAERMARDEQARRDALHRSVMVSFVEACGKLQAAIHMGRFEDVYTQCMWAASRATQVRMLLHSEGKVDVFDWFNSQWSGPYRKLRFAFSKSTHFNGKRTLYRKEINAIYREFLLIEHLCARWATQPISEWTTDLPPAWLAFRTEPPPLEGSEDGGE